MPVTFTVSDKQSEPWRSYNGQRADNRNDLFARSCAKEARESERVIHSSLSASDFATAHIVPSTNGFVHAAWYAYSYHHHLTIRPDDIWFAILSQLNFYINANAEALRSHFVAHEGQKELVIKDIGSMATLDYGLFARQMTLLIQENVKDPDFRDWIMPTFSTTTVDDRSTAAVLMMGSLQAYFAYTSMCMCGIPSVTLLGTREDYVDIRARLDKLHELGEQAADFATLLRPVLDGFVASFEDEMSAQTKDFWGRMVHYEGGSGMSRLTGWIAAFCFWRNDGVPMYKREHAEHYAKRGLTLDNVSYHGVETSDIPCGFASVPVLVNDNGVLHRTKMVAGSLGMRVGGSGEKDGEDKEEKKLDRLGNLTGWVMFEVKESVGKEGGRRTRGEGGVIVDTRF